MINQIDQNLTKSQKADQIRKAKQSISQLQELITSGGWELIVNELTSSLTGSAVALAASSKMDIDSIHFMRGVIATQHRLTSLPEDMIASIESQAILLQDPE